MSPQRIVVVGADAAGMSAASQALRTARGLGRQVQVTVLERTRHTSYSACGLPYWVAGEVDGPDALVARTPEQHRAAGIDLRTEASAVGVDLAGRRVTVQGPGGTEVLDFDDLVLATGADPELPDWAVDADGHLLEGVAPLKTLDDGATWRDLLDGPARAVTVVGGGYIGLEMCEAALARGHRVTLATRSRVMSRLDPAMSARSAEALRGSGVTVLTDTPVSGLRLVHGRPAAVQHPDGETATDLVLVALGVRPNTALVAGQLPDELVGPSGGLRPDPHGRVVEGLWAAGDCVEVRHRLSGEWVHLPLGTHANKHGRALGDSVVRIPAGRAPHLHFDGALGTAITRFAGPAGPVEVGQTGLSLAGAERAGLDAVALTTEGSTVSGYMPDAEPMAVQVVAERGSRRLLGVEVVGGTGSAKRVDAAAAVLWYGGTVDDLAWMDLSYAPPFATAWELLQVASRRVAEQLDRDDLT